MVVGSQSSNAVPTVKFLCSYGGKILPRYPDAKLRYHGGETRVLSVNRSISFSELMVKLGELCGTPVSLRCQLPTEDLDALVSITSDEDLANVIEEYDRAASPATGLKIRAFLSQPKSARKPSPPAASSSSGTSPRSVHSVPRIPNSRSPATASSSSSGASPRSVHSFSAIPISRSPAAGKRCIHQMEKPGLHRFQKSGAGVVQFHRQYGYHGNPSYAYMVHNGNYWQ